MTLRLHNICFYIKCPFSSLCSIKLYVVLNYVYSQLLLVLYSMCSFLLTRVLDVLCEVITYISCSVSGCPTLLDDCSV